MLRYRSSSLSKEDSRSQILCSTTKDETLATSPSTVMILHKIKLLFESKKYDECALMIRRLSSSVAEVLLSELPIVDFIDAIPQSFVILDALCSKASLLGPNCQLATHLRPKLLVTYIVRWASGLKQSSGVPQKSFDHYRPVLKRLFTVLTLIHPSLKDELRARRATLEKCQQGLGQHGLVTSPLDSTKMTTIHDALKNACIHTIQCMKLALHKLDDIGPSHAGRVRVPVQRDSVLTSASHQRQVQVTLKEVENRLILNKSLLDAVETSAMTVSGSFSEMLGSLRQRIESDKEVLFCLTELRREIPGQSLSIGCSVMPQIQQLVQGYGIVIELLEEVAPVMMSDLEDDSESERDEAKIKINESKNGRLNTFPGKTSGKLEDQRKAFTAGSPLTCDVRQVETSMTSDPRQIAGRQSDQQRQEIERLKKEVELAKKQLATCQQTILQFQEREKNLVERLSTQAQTQLQKSTTKFEDVNLGVNRPTQLIRRYGNLYAESRIDVLDALDELPELDDLDDLKTKLLFSIVILAFRSAERSLKEFKMQMTKLLDLTGESNSQTERNLTEPMVKDIESSLLLYLRKTADRKNLSENVKDVCAQVWQTLYDYPSLKKCQGLQNFISETVRLAWALTIQNPSYVLEFESRRFSMDRHAHFHTSNSDSDVIRTYVWPGLREGEDGPVVYRGVVIT